MQCKYKLLAVLTLTTNVMHNASGNTAFIGWGLALLILFIHTQCYGLKIVITILTDACSCLPMLIDEMSVDGEQSYIQYCW